MCCSVAAWCRSVRAAKIQRQTQRVCQRCTQVRSKTPPASASHYCVFRSACATPCSLGFSRRRMGVCIDTGGSSNATPAILVWWIRLLWVGRPAARERGSSAPAFRPAAAFFARRRRASGHKWLGKTPAINTNGPTSLEPSYSFIYTHAFNYIYLHLVFCVWFQLL